MLVISEGTADLTPSADVADEANGAKIAGCNRAQRPLQAAPWHPWTSCRRGSLHHFLSLVFVRDYPPREGLQDAVANSVLNRLGTGAIECHSGDEASTALPSSLPPASLPISVVSGSEIILFQEKIDFPDFLADSFWIFPEKQISLPEMSRHRRLHFLVRLIIGIVHNSPHHPRENPFNHV